MRVVKYLEMHPQLATPLKSWLSRKPLLKSRLRRISYQVPVVSKTESSITEEQGKEREAVDLSGLTPSAKRLYKLSLLERERRSLYDNVPTFVFSEVELEARSGRMLKNLQNYR